MLKLLPLGGAQNIGASCFYLNIYGTGILLDCGIDPRKFGIEALPDFNLLNDLPIDFVIISHAHQDHIGALPFLIQKIPHVIIYSTPQTKEIAELTLHNAANIISEQANDFKSFKPYTHEEIDLLVGSFKTYKYGESFQIKGLRQQHKENIKITFYDAGHILGSASILIEHNDYKIFYSGDINLSPQKIMNGAVLPNTEVDTLIIESTYASTESHKLSNWKNEIKRFTKAANKILTKGGSILIPVFSLGKTQEILASINEVMENGQLTECYIYSGGIAKQISKLYDLNRYLINCQNTDLELKNIPQINLYSINDFAQFEKKTGIVLASSGMMIEGTLSFKLSNFWLKQNKFGIFIVGYMDENSPGYKIMNSQKGDTIRMTPLSEEIKVSCDVERFYFPSHSKREELLLIVQKLKAKKVILIHGEESARNWMGYNILKNFEDVKVLLSSEGKWINLI